ncbi:MAG: RluA family pseudouridine synthase [Candidatus Aminicenantales bacterium]
MVKREFFVDAPEKGQRLDVYLTQKIDELTRSQVKKLIGQDKVIVNGEPSKSSRILREGDRIEFEFQMTERAGINPENIPLKILYQDPHFLVIDKPAGMIVHPGAGAREGTLVNALLFHFPEIRGLGAEERPGIVHRLDKETSGVMVVARTLKAYISLRQQFKKREVRKIYLGLIVGRMPLKEGRISWPIGRHVKHGQKISVKTRKPKEAETYYSVRKEFDGFSLLEITPVTGRTHQIRVHFSTAGHPLAGDRLYGRRPPDLSPVKFPRLFLHAHCISFRHPLTDNWLEFCSPLPRELEEILDSLQ